MSIRNSSVALIMYFINLILQFFSRKIFLDYLQIFKELFSIRFVVIATLCFCAYKMSSNLITLWIGSEYLLPNSTLGLLVITLFLSLIRGTTDSFIAGYGLFGDIWAPIVEAGLNIGFSVLLGYFYGLNGVLLGVVISQLLVIYCWKPYYLFTRKLKGYLVKYCCVFLIHITLGAVVWILSELVCSHILTFLWDNNLNIGTFILQGVSVSMIYGIVLPIILNIFKCGVDSFFNRIFSYVRK